MESLDWMKHAREMLGTHEIVGPKHNPTVVQFFVDAQHTEIKNDEVPWCAAFVGAMLKRAGIKPSGSLMARSYEAWGQPLLKPIYGCIAVKKRPGGGYLGHVGFCVGANKSQIILLGGNQNDQVSIAAFPRSQFTAYRWPANIAVPKGLQLPTSVEGAKVGSRQS